MSRTRALFSAALGCLLLCMGPPSCIGLLFITMSVLRPPQPPPGVWRCSPLPETFQKSHLVGVWRANYGGSTDILIIRADGTYKQIYFCEGCNEMEGYYFESSWNRWWLEQRPSGGLYLHLEGMRRCDNLDGQCIRGNGGWDFLYLDFCENRPGVEMPGEVILMVTGTGNRPAPRGIELWHMAVSVESGASYFELEGEEDIDTDSSPYRSTATPHGPSQGLDPWGRLSRLPSPRR